MCNVHKCDWFSTGHASLIGEKTGQCLGYAVKVKKCRTCTYAEKAQKPPKEHICCKNWFKSAKAMEPAMACDMLKEINDQGHKVLYLVFNS